MRQFLIVLKFLFFLFALTLPGTAFELPSSSKQVVVGVARSWETSHVAIYLYEKKGRQWHQVAGPWPGRLGKKGLAWGLGLHPVPQGAATKREGDRKAPAGVFRIGGAWGYAPITQINKHPKLFYRQVTTRDLWSENPSSPHYNRHRVLEHEPTTASEKKDQMKQNDYPHSLKVFIGHNSPPRVVPGAGSSIFFHIWRGGGSRPTSGCTTLPENHLKTLLARLNPDLQPLYILLPQNEYERLRAPWKLP